MIAAAIYARKKHATGRGLVPHGSPPRPGLKSQDCSDGKINSVGRLFTRRRPSARG